MTLSFAKKKWLQRTREKKKWIGGRGKCAAGGRLKNRPGGGRGAPAEYRGGKRFAERRSRRKKKGGLGRRWEPLDEDLVGIVSK